MQNGEVYTINQNGQMAYAGASSGAMVTVLLSGYTYQAEKGTTMYATTTGAYIDIADGWTWTRSVTYSRSQAQAQVDKIIRNNKKIIEHNLLCARYASKLSTTERKTLYGLQSRLMERNEALQNYGLCTNIETSYPRGYAELEQYMTTFMASSGVGLATWVVVVVAATIVASTATAAYFAYKYYADQSERDVKFSEDLTRTLTSKLTEEEYQQLLAETKGIVTKARIKQSLSSVSGLIGYALMGVGAYMLYNVIKERV